MEQQVTLVQVELRDLGRNGRELSLLLTLARTFPGLAKSCVRRQLTQSAPSPHPGASMTGGQQIPMPRLSNVIDPQSRLIRVENVFGERPRGPVQVYASVCQASLWISDSPLRAMNGFRGVRGT